MIEDSGFLVTLRRVVFLLEQADIKYLLTGGVLTSIWGDPRATQDIDVVVVLKEMDKERLVTTFQESFLISELMLTKALLEGGMVQLLDNQTSIKVDLHVQKQPEDSFSRATRAVLFKDIVAMVPTKEDAIISKLKWIQRGSFRSRKDVKGMLLNSHPIDRALLSRLADQEGCSDLLKEIESENLDID